MAEIFLGVVADDFTGASDAASMLSEAGVPTVLFNGIPEKSPELRPDIRAVVVAEKTRTMPKAEAVSEMLKAFDWLKKIGAKQLYFKYCATFDSTSEGNIGPVADAVLDDYGIPSTVLVPALPVNGRIVKHGKLYVNGVPLEESHMRNHPLTPMTESSVKKLIEMQSKYSACEISIEDMEGGLKWEKYQKFKESVSGEKHYIIPDFYEDVHGDLIAEIFGDIPFLTGGSGLCGALGRRYVKLHGAEIKGTELRKNQSNDKREGKTLLLAGSCSKITLEQIDDYKTKKNPSIFMDPVMLMEDRISAAEVFTQAENMGDRVLVYSSQKPEEMKKTQKLGLEKVASKIETAMGTLANEAVKKGYANIISAGGETSGAVTKALGYSAFYIGKSVAPGVPVMTPLDNEKLRIVLKSGGFGQTDFFERAINLVSET
ncbi:MAG: four-carbon acid sugar kinase family protein [Oribacterium sp.]|nr:four-carbon acid sugar kinase family protein [Oribacterium sp.]